MSLAEFFVRHLGYRIWLTYRGETAILKYYRQFSPLWRADREKLEALKMESLRAILIHAAQTTEYYKSCFGRLGFDPRSVKRASDIAALPFLTKEDLNRKMNEVLSSSFKRAELVQSSTGGSSGVPLTFYRDRRATAMRRAQDHLFNAMIRVHAGAKRAWVWGSPLDVVKMRKLRTRIANFLTERAIHFYSFDTTPATIESFLQQLNRHRPEVIFAYPNMLAAIAEHARNESIRVEQVGKVIVTAEPLWEWQRLLFKEVFGAETFERYGSREFGTFASEGYDHEGMHIFEPGYCCEVIDSDGEPVAEGEMGELVITDFFNYAMPLIRYRTGDMVRIEDRLCSCGCSWRRIVAIGGRIADMLLRPDGSRVAGLVIVNALHTTGVRTRVQVVQTSVDALTVKHLISATVPVDIKNRLQRRLDEVFGAPVNITYLPVEELTYDKSGKYRYVTSECSKDVYAVG